MTAMGTFRVDIEVESPRPFGERVRVSDVLVNTGAELSWLPTSYLERIGVERKKIWRFRQTDGSLLERWAGYAIIHAGETSTIDEVVFGEPADLVLLGARTLEGLNLRVDPTTKRLVDAGPAAAAVAA